MAKVKKGDLVIVIAGRDRGKSGRVLSVDTARDRIVVEGIQRVKRHNKIGQTQRGTKTGGIETFEASIHVSNVMVADPSDRKRPTRVGYRTEDVTLESGRTKTRRVRVAKRSGKDI